MKLFLVEGKSEILKYFFLYGCPPPQLGEGTRREGHPPGVHPVFKETVVIISCDHLIHALILYRINNVQDVIVLDPWKVFYSDKSSIVSVADIRKSLIQGNKN